MKLSLAAALSHRPKLLILDEATSGLDPIVRDEILDEFLGFIQDDDHAILISSHITSDLEKAADYITYIHQGQVVLSDAKDRILDNYGRLAWHRRTAELCGPRRFDPGTPQLLRLRGPGGRPGRLPPPVSRTAGGADHAGRHHAIHRKGGSTMTGLVLKDNARDAKDP